MVDLPLPRVDLVALVVDEVQDVLGLPDGCLQDAPALHALSAKMIGVRETAPTVSPTCSTSTSCSRRPWREVTARCPTSDRCHACAGRTRRARPRGVASACRVAGAGGDRRAGVRQARTAPLPYRRGVVLRSGVADVREIFQEYDLTPIPCVPPHILGRRSMCAVRSSR